MSKGKFDIKSILDIPRWEAVQDQLAKATGTAIITIDYKGTPITKHSMRTDFCSIIRENPISCKRCQKCDSLAGLEAVRLNQPFIYLCHCGIVDVAVPITVGDQYLGAVMFGQVRISNGSDAGVERLVNEISAVHTDDAVSALQPDLCELYQRLPEMEYERIRGIADMINAIVQYIVACAVDNRARMMSYEWRLRSLPGDVHAAGADVPVEIHALTGKVERAKELLRSTPDSVSAIASALGFLDVSYFVKLFKRFEGVTPLTYRKLKRSSSAAPSLGKI